MEPWSLAVPDWRERIRTGRSLLPELPRLLYEFLPKKSSKTSYAAALMVTTLLMNERPRAEFLLVAPTVSLAHIAFSQALGMVDKDPDGFLRKRLHVQEHLRKITDRRTKATLEIKAFDTT
ncbi:MAG: terminase large subunit, partial [Alphaproteobacteria bacterium]|nr:terminase large subunit [Alphaproteobacteria bacterium]